MLRIAAAHLLRDAAQLPRQKPGRSRVVWIGRPAGEVSESMSGTPPTQGCSARPNSAWTRTVDGRTGLGLIVDRVAASRGRFEMARREPFDRLAARPAEPRFEHPVQRCRVDIAKRR